MCEKMVKWLANDSKFKGNVVLSHFNVLKHFHACNFERAEKPIYVYVLAVGQMCIVYHIMTQFISSPFVSIWCGGSRFNNKSICIAKWSAKNIIPCNVSEPANSALGTCIYRRRKVRHGPCIFINQASHFIWPTCTTQMCVKDRLCYLWRSKKQSALAQCCKEDLYNLRYYP